MRASRKRRMLVAGLAAGSLLLVSSLRAEDGRSVIRGVVSDAAGRPVAGAFVKLKNDEQRLTFMVISRENGQFEAVDLPAGDYRVQGIGGDFQSDWFNKVAATAGGDAKVGLYLNQRRGPQLAPAWPQRIPEADVLKASKDPKDLPEGGGKELVAQTCTLCHDLLRVVVKRSNQDQWAHTVERMRGQMFIRAMPDLTDAQAATIVSYLTTRFGETQPYDANSRLPRTFLTGKAVNYRVVTYDLINTHAEPHDVAMDPQGNAWVSEQTGDKLGRFNGKTLEFTEFDPPPGPAAKGRQHLGNPQIDRKGMLWVTDGPNGRWLSYDTTTSKFLAFAFPKGKGSPHANSMTLSPDGTVWATGANKEARQLIPDKAEFRFFESPSAGGRTAPGAYGIAVAGDGAIWWAEDRADKMARVDPVSGKVEEFKIPYQGRAFPRRMSADANGDVWVGLWTAGKLMKVDHRTRQMTLYTPPTVTGGNYSVVVDKKNGFVWVSEHQADKIARFDPGTETWVEFPLPEAESDPRRIDIDPTNPDRIYFSGNTPGRVGFLEVLPD